MIVLRSPVNHEDFKAYYALRHEVLHPGTPRQPSPDAASVEAAEEHERQDILRRADEIREQSRRRAIFLQENPPDADWAEPPRYELL